MQFLAGAVRLAARETIRKGHGIHRSRRLARNHGDLDPAILEQGVENASGEGAMRPTALKRQVDPFGVVRLFLRMIPDLGAHLAVHPCSGAPTRSGPVPLIMIGYSWPVDLQCLFGSLRCAASLALGQRTSPWVMRILSRVPAPYV